MKKSNAAAQERADTADASTGQPDSRNRITNNCYVADDEDPFAALVEQLADATEVAA